MRLGSPAKHFSIPFIAFYWLGFYLFSGILLAKTPESLGDGLINPGFEEKPAWFKESFLDLREDIDEASAAGKLVMLYFYQDGCPYCAKLLKDNFRDSEIVKTTRRHFDVIALNIWGDREVTDLAGEATTEKAFAQALRVQFTPTFLILDENGKVLIRLNGYFEPAKFKIVLSYLVQRLDKKGVALQQFYLARQKASKPATLNEFPIGLPRPLRLAENRKTSQRPLLVLFEQKNCHPCDELHEHVFKRQEIVTALSAFDLAQVDLHSGDVVQTPDGQVLAADHWARSLGVNYAPSLIFFASNGKEVFRTEAYLKTFHLHAAMDYVATGAYLWQPNFQRFIQHRADLLEAMGLHVDLMQ